MTRLSPKYNADFIQKALKLEFEIGTLAAGKALGVTSGRFRHWRQHHPELRHPGAPLAYPRGRGTMGKTMNVDSEGRFVKEGAAPAPRRTSAAPNSQNLSEVQSAIALADKLGLRPAAAQLGMPFSTLRNWRTNMRKYGRISIPQQVRYTPDRPRKAHREEPIQRAAKRAPLIRVEGPSLDVFSSLDIESTFERGFHRGFNAAVTLFKIDLTGEEGANNE